MSILTYRKPQSLRRRSGSASAFSVEKVRETANRLETIFFEDLPDWCKDNEHVRSGYRQVSNSTLSCIKSCGAVHNETMNILTHLIPAIVLVFLQIIVQVSISHRFPDATILDRLVIGSNIFAAIVTFGLSASYHTLMNHSMEISMLWLRIDYVGILTLILGSFFSGIYVGFYCQPTPRALYWSMIASLSVLTAFLVLHPRFQGLQYRSLRSYAFVATGLTGFAPIGHGLYLYGWDEMWVRSGMPYYFLEGIMYLAGAFFFVTRIPESIWPGAFDIWWSSHQLFHMLVVAAAAVHIYGVWNAFDWNYHNMGSCSSLQ